MRPSLDQTAGAGEAVEQALFEALVPQPADHSLGEAVLHGLARRDGVPGAPAVSA